MCKCGCCVQVWVLCASVGVVCKCGCCVQVWVLCASVGVVCKCGCCVRVVLCASVGVVCECGCCVRVWVLCASVGVVCECGCCVRVWVLCASVGVVCECGCCERVWVLCASVGVVCKCGCCASGVLCASGGAKHSLQNLVQCVAAIPSTPSTLALAEPGDEASCMEHKNVMIVINKMDSITCTVETKLCKVIVLYNLVITSTHKHSHSTPT